MSTYEDDAPRLSEIGRVLQGLDRKLDDFRAEVRAQLSDKVSKEVYIAERAALMDQVNASKERIVAIEAKHRSNTNTIYGGLASIIVGVILFYIQAKG